MCGTINIPPCSKIGVSICLENDQPFTGHDVVSYEWNVLENQTNNKDQYCTQLAIGLIHVDGFGVVADSILDGFLSFKS